MSWLSPKAQKARDNAAARDASRNLMQQYSDEHRPKRNQLVLTQRWDGMRCDWKYARVMGSDATGVTVKFADGETDRKSFSDIVAVGP